MRAWRSLEVLMCALALLVGAFMIFGWPGLVVVGVLMLVESLDRRSK